MEELEEKEKEKEEDKTVTADREKVGNGKLFDEKCLSVRSTTVVLCMHPMILDE